MYMCVYMFVCIYIYMHIHVCVCVCECVHMCVQDERAPGGCPRCGISSSCSPVPARPVTAQCHRYKGTGSGTRLPRTNQKLSLCPPCVTTLTGSSVSKYPSCAGVEHYSLLLAAPRQREIQAECHHTLTHTHTLQCVRGGHVRVCVRALGVIVHLVKRGPLQCIAIHGS